MLCRKCKPQGSFEIKSGSWVCNANLWISLLSLKRGVVCIFQDRLHRVVNTPILEIGSFEVGG